MGFGFNLFTILFLIPFTCILGVAWLFTRKRILGKILAITWGCVIAVFILSGVTNFFTSKKQIDRNDIYGTYVIDRDMFKGGQTDWQYNHFRFEITRQNQFLFHTTDNEKIIKTFKGRVSFIDSYASPRLVIAIDTPTHHVIDTQPTLYRFPFSFYYVFHSPKFGNVFFTKGKWEPLDK